MVFWHSLSCQMFHPAANRLAGFLEVSALFINLAHSGGYQLKAGYMAIESTKTGGGFGRKSATWKEKKESRWCAVRDGYIVVVDEPGEVIYHFIRCICLTHLSDPSLRFGTFFFLMPTLISNVRSVITARDSNSYIQTPPKIKKCIILRKVSCSRPRTMTPGR
jgi:hypothetical protein